jgi:hypothetical protein
MPTPLPPAAPELSRAEAFDALGDVPYVIGTDLTYHHAIAHKRVTAVLQAEKAGFRLPAVAACGATAAPIPQHGAFHPANPAMRTDVFDRCPHCRWIAAIDQHTETAELELFDQQHYGDSPQLALEPSPPSPMRRLCAAILADSDCDPDYPLVIQLLGHATAHAPQTLMAEDCAEDSCDHDRGTCPSWLGCATCSVVAGTWAGEREGQHAVECSITAPCQVLQTLATHYNVTLGPLAEATR